MMRIPGAFGLGALAVFAMACGSDPAPASGAANPGDPGSPQADGGASGDGASPGNPTTPITTGDVFGPVHSGSYNLGPVDYAETQFHNACAPAEKYPAQIQALYGPYLAGTDNSLGGDGSLCDACALITTRLGKKLLLHNVTYGQSKAPGDMDLSPEAYNAIYEMDPMGTSDIPRPMSWQLAKCQTTDKIYLEFQTGANAYWTSFWVRNAILPITGVQSKASGANAFSMLTRTPDGPFTNASGVGMGSFDLQITGSDGQMVTQTLTGFTPGAVVQSTMQFQVSANAQTNL